MQADAETSPSKQQRARSQSLPPAPRRQSVEDLERLSGKSLDDGFYSDEEDETTTAIQAPSDETTEVPSDTPPAAVSSSRRRRSLRNSLTGLRPFGRRRQSLDPNDLPSKKREPRARRMSFSGIRPFRRRHSLETAQSPKASTRNKRRTLKRTLSESSLPAASAKPNTPSKLLEVSMPDMSGSSRCMSNAQVKALVASLPSPDCHLDLSWTLLFHSLDHGSSLQTLYARTSTRPYTIILARP